MPVAKLFISKLCLYVFLCEPSFVSDHCEPAHCPMVSPRSLTWMSSKPASQPTAPLILLSMISYLKTLLPRLTAIMQINIDFAGSHMGWALTAVTAPSQEWKRHCATSLCALWSQPCHDLLHIVRENTSFCWCCCCFLCHFFVFLTNEITNLFCRSCTVIGQLPRGIYDDVRVDADAEFEWVPPVSRAGRVLVRFSLLEKRKEVWPEFLLRYARCARADIKRGYPAKSIKTLLFLCLSSRIT